MKSATVTALIAALLMASPAHAVPSKQAKKQQVQKKRGDSRSKRPVQRQARPDQNQQDRGLLKLDLATRVEQRCNERASSDLSRENRDLKVDRVIAYAFADTEVNGTEVVAPGAIARSKGKWYRLSFRCRTTADGLGIVSFEHDLGAEVPGWDQDRLED
jgi:hypothetical protein